MSEAQAHEVTLRLLKELASELPEHRRRDVLARYGLVTRLLDVDNDESAQAVAQELLQDALSV